jgi:hypothetical protein
MPKKGENGNNIVESRDLETKRGFERGRCPLCQRDNATHILLKC